MELYFFRHGLAAPKDDAAYPNDADRPLTDEGIRKTREAAQGLRSLGISCDRILTSPWIRASQTADVVAKVLDLRKQVDVVPELAGDRSVGDLLAALGDHRESRLLLVGHEPQMSMTISRLLSGGPEIQIELKKSGVGAIEVESLPPQKPGKLLWLLTAKQLRQCRG